MLARFGLDKGNKQIDIAARSCGLVCDGRLRQAALAALAQAVSQAKGPRTPHTGIRNWRRGVAGAPLGWDDPRSDPAGVALSGGGGRCGPL